MSFVGARTNAFGATHSLFRDVLGVETAFTNPGWAGFRLPSGARDLFEIFGPEMTDERVAPAAFAAGVLVAFAVGDVVRARAELDAAGVELIGDIVWADTLTGRSEDHGWGWFFFRAPDGIVYVIQQDGLSAND